MAPLSILVSQEPDLGVPLGVLDASNSLLPICLGSNPTRAEVLVRTGPVQSRRERRAESSSAHCGATRQEGGGLIGFPQGQTLGGEQLDFLSRLKSSRKTGQRMTACLQKMQGKRKNRVMPTR